MTPTRLSLKEEEERWRAKRSRIADLLLGMQKSGWYNEEQTKPFWSKVVKNVLSEFWKPRGKSTGGVKLMNIITDV